MATQLRLDYARAKVNLYDLPWPVVPEPESIKPTGFKFHWCGLSGHWLRCRNVSRCTLPEKTPCASCENYVRAGYRPGRYARR